MIRHVTLFTFVCALGVGSVADVGAREPKDEPVEVKSSELARLRAAAAKVEALEQRVATLERDKVAALEALRVANQRLGLEPFAPGTLAASDFVVKLPSAARLDALGGKAKNASLQRTLDGTRRGMVVAYWATWCKPCTSPEELARLGELKRTLATQGADLVFMAIDELDKVTSDARAKTWLYPLWQRDDGHFDMLPEAYVRGDGVELPLMLVVAKSGRVRWVRKGALDDGAMQDIVTAVIRGDM